MKKPFIILAAVAMVFVACKKENATNSLGNDRTVSHQQIKSHEMLEFEKNSLFSQFYYLLILLTIN